MCVFLGDVDVLHMARREAADCPSSPVGPPGVCEFAVSTALVAKVFEVVEERQIWASLLSRLGGARCQSESQVVGDKEHVMEGLLKWTSRSQERTGKTFPRELPLSMKSSSWCNWFLQESERERSKFAFI